MINNQVIDTLTKSNFKKDNIFGECLLNLGYFDKALEFFEEKHNNIRCGKICMELTKEYYKEFMYYNI